MANFWDDLKRIAKEVTETVTEKTKTYSKMAGIKIKILDLKSKTDKSFQALGQSYFEGIQSGSVDPEQDTIKEKIEKLKSLKEEIKALKDEYEQVKKEEKDD